MKEGFVNFQRVEKGQLIASNANGEIRSPKSGFIFMPLYQSQGYDGFFIVKEIKPFWFNLSSRTRKWKLDKVLAILPGITKSKEGSSGYLIEKNIAKFKVVALMHMLGYRKVFDNGNSLKMTRRPYDSRFPKVDQVRKNFVKYLDLLKN